MTDNRMPRRSPAGRATDHCHPAQRPGAGPDTRPGGRTSGSGGSGGAKPWAKATALVAVSASGVVTGMSLAHAPASELVSPSGTPATLPPGLQQALQAKLVADGAVDPAAQPSASQAGGAEVSVQLLSVVRPDRSQTSGPEASVPAAKSSEPSASSSAKSSSALPKASAQQEFIASVAPGAIAAEQKYGVPASVTIAQAIDESDWGRSALAAKDDNLFGIKGVGPAGSVTYQTSEFEGGQWITIDAQFRAYKTVAQSIDDHAALLATSGYYTKAMALAANPDAFANALTGVYATDPTYGSTLIALMRTYGLYKYDTPQAPATAAAPATHAAAQPTHITQTAPQHTASTPASSQPTASIPGLMQQWSTSAGSSQSIASIPGLVQPSTSTYAAPHPATASGASHHAAGTSATSQPTASIPGVLQPAAAFAAAHQTAGASAASQPAANIPGVVQSASAAVTTATLTAWYTPSIPATVTAAYTQTAKPAIGHMTPLYQEAAARAGISWKLLAACDWMQCAAEPRRSPVYGEKLGAANQDGSSYGTKSQALARCAADLAGLAAAVYGIDLTVRKPLSVRALAEVFAAYRWGGMLARDGVSAMEFPYSVAGLTAAHTGMRWPAVPGAPDRPGAKFRQQFGAVPVALHLGYPATV